MKNATTKIFALWQFDRDSNGNTHTKVCAFGTRKQMDNLMTNKVIEDATNNNNARYYKIFCNR